MLEGMLQVAGGILLFICLSVLLVVLAATVLAVIRLKVRIPKGVEVLFRNTPYPCYVDIAHPMRVDLNIAKQYSALLVHDHLERMFRGSLRVYYFEYDPKALGKVREESVHIITKEGLEKARRGEDINFPKMHIFLHTSALTPEKYS